MIIRYFSVQTRCELKLKILLVIFLIFLSFPQTLLSQEERVAVISKYKGQVKVSHDAVWKDVNKVGNRIRNSSVYDEDEVMTMPDSTADMIFNDNTHLEVKEDTTLKITTKQLSEEERGKKGFIRTVADTQRNSIRTINMKIGKLWANITPSKSVLTEFETPVGVATVRGTIISLAFDGINTLIEVFQGLMEFKSTDDVLSFEITGGVKANISSPAAGIIKVEVLSGELSIPTGAGDVGVGEGSTMTLKADNQTGGSVVTDVEGDVTITDESGNTTDLESGKDLGTLPGSTSDSGNVKDSTETFQQDSVNDYGNVVQGDTTGGTSGDTSGGTSDDTSGEASEDTSGETSEDTSGEASDDTFAEASAGEEPYFEAGNLSQDNQTTKESSSIPEPSGPLCHLTDNFDIGCDPLGDIFDPITNK